MDVLNEALKNYPKPEIFNTDQGSQYTSYIHTQTLKDNGITISMDSKGRATDNIAIERFWRSAKCERIYLNEFVEKIIKEPLLAVLKVLKGVPEDIFHVELKLRR